MIRKSEDLPEKRYRNLRGQEDFCCTSVDQPGHPGSILIGSGFFMPESLYRWKKTTEVHLKPLMIVAAIMRPMYGWW
ncbi:MAG: hypothetical protein JKY62_05455 [Desulfocapsa sp.]|nr:hypothetical protein [Desulfocapsa sp.]MBN4063939.1 hypothetical protein [bacterium AH-315-I07]